MNVIRKFLFVSWPPILVLGLHLLRQVFLPLDTWVDTIAHFSGGAAIAWSAANVYGLLRERQMVPTLPLWFQWFVFIATAELVGVLWEFLEFLFLSSNPMYGITYADTISDLTMDLLGAITLSTILIFFFSHKKTA